MSIENSVKRTLFLNRMVKPYTRIFNITILVVAMVLFFLILYGSYRTDELNNHTLINQPLVQLDNYLTDMDTVAQNAMSNELLIKKFSDLRQEAIMDNHFSKDILNAIETSSILHNISGVRSDIFRISAYNNKGDYVSYGATVNMKEAYESLMASNVDKYMKDFANGDADYILIKPGLDYWSTAFKSDYISLIRPIMNVYSRDVVGVVEIQKNKQALIASVYPDANSGKKINIYNEKGEGVHLLPDMENYRVIASVTSNAYGWRIDLLEEKSLLWQSIAEIFFSVVAGCVVIIFLARNIVARITRKIAWPLENLKKSVESIDVSKPSRIDTKDLDIEEVYSVAVAFNTLMESVTFLTAQEKKAYLFALQAQMNPHFLYNVLSIINAAAIEGNGDAVIDIVGSLSDMLRYTSSFENSVTRLEEEVRHTEQYLKLMKARYAEMFTYKITMESSLKDEIVPKLAIQPLCENCFNHGFADIEPPYRITVSIKVEERGWSVEVQDNGKGFSEEERKSLLYRANRKSHRDLNNMQIGGLGVLSSIIRMRMITGKNVSCKIINQNPKGALIKLKVTDNATQA